MKKKIMAVTLCLAMVSTFAVGCGQKNETDSGKSEEKSSGKVEIEFVQVKREAAESYTKVIEAFEKENPDIVIKQNVVPDAQEVLMTRASSDSLPDMMNHWPTDAQFVQFEDEGLLLDLSEKDYMKNIDSKYLDAVKAKDGKNYIAPYNVNFMGVYYNKDKFEELENYLKEMVIVICSGKENTKKKSKIVEEIVHYVENNYYKNISLRELAENKYFVNYSYCSRLFSQETGMNFSKYLIQYRLKKAKTLLENKDMKISFIAFEVGYNDVSHFIQSFKKSYGLTPEEYRARKKIE